MYRFSRNSRLSLAPLALAAAATALLGLAMPLTAAHADERLAEWDFQGPSPYTPINGEYSFGRLSGRNAFPQDDLRVIDASIGNPAPSMTINTIARSLTRINYVYYSYLSVEITPLTGYQLNLTSLSFDMAVNRNPLGTWNSDGRATAAVALYGRPNPNFDNDFAYDDLLGGAAVFDSTPDDRFGAFTRVTFDLTRPRYQGLLREDELRLYFASSGESDFALQPEFTPSDLIAIDNILLTGTAVPIRAEVAAPEPGSVALLLPILGVVGLAIRKRHGYAAKAKA